MYLYVFIYTDTYWYIHIVYMYLFMALVRNQHVLSSLCAFLLRHRWGRRILDGLSSSSWTSYSYWHGKVIRDQNWLVQTVGSLACFFLFLFFFRGYFLKTFESVSRFLGAKHPQPVCVVKLSFPGGRFSAYVESELSQVKVMSLGFSKKTMQGPSLDMGCWCKHGWFVCIYIYM